LNALKAQKSSQPWNMVPSICMRGVVKFVSCGRTDRRLERRVDTSRDDLDRIFAQRPPMRILIESSTDSEWVAQHLKRVGHEVIVADPNYAAMYGSRSRKVKTDRRDAAALAEACRTEGCIAVRIGRRQWRASLGSASGYAHIACASAPRPSICYVHCCARTVCGCHAAHPSAFWRAWIS
jgi:hypothetical protein